MASSNSFKSPRVGPAVTSTDTPRSRPQLTLQTSDASAATTYNSADPDSNFSRRPTPGGALQPIPLLPPNGPVIERSNVASEEESGIGLLELVDYRRPIRLTRTFANAVINCERAFRETSCDFLDNFNEGVVVFFKSFKELITSVSCNWNPEFLVSNPISTFILLLLSIPIAILCVCLSCVVKIIREIYYCFDPDARCYTIPRRWYGLPAPPLIPRNNRYRLGESAAAQVQQQDGNGVSFRFAANYFSSPLQSSPVSATPPVRAESPFRAASPYRVASPVRATSPERRYLFE
ncbi:hypothetical protein BZA70DRAFT_287352 [Myxozyma melibiosi]|uniref:Brl1/Brr6 domain-containing protein n=1 Tax=Myxozyma melibiosi TaxID=54550 RepID=A0ABR1FDU3_9ASCO